MNGVSSIPLGILSPDQRLGDHSPVEMLDKMKLRRKSPSEYPPFIDKVKALMSKCDDEYRGYWRLLYGRGVKCEKFFQGEHWGRINYAGQWQSMPRQAGDAYHTHNEYRAHCSAIQSQWVQSHPETIARPLPFDETNDKTAGVARIANYIGGHYERTILTEPFMQKECEFGMWYGSMFRKCGWNIEKGKGRKRPQFGLVDRKMTDPQFQCPECGVGGDPSQAPGGRCPACGAPVINVGRGLQKMLQVTGYEDFKQGDFDTTCSHPLEWKHDLHCADIYGGLWARQRVYVRPELAEFIYDWYTHVPNPQRYSSSYTAETEGYYIRNLQLSVGNITTGSSSNVPFYSTSTATDVELVALDQWYFKPEFFGAYQLPEDMEFANGDKLKAGDRITDYYPDGMKVTAIDMEPVEFANKALCDEVEHTPFIIIGSRVRGDGTEDLVENNIEYNMINSIIFTHIKASGSPPMFFNPQITSSERVSGKPDEVAPIKPVDDPRYIQYAVWPVPVNNISPITIPYSQGLRAGMQFYGHTFSQVTGAPEVAAGQVGGDTATAFQGMQGAAQAMRGPELALRGAGNVVWKSILFRSFIKYATYPQCITIQGQHGEQEMAWFKGSQIDNEFALELKPRSWVPRNEMDRQRNFAAWLGIGNGIMLNPQLNPRMRHYSAEAFGIPNDVIDTYNDDVRLARKRLEQMKKLLPQVQKLAPVIADQMMQQAQLAGAMAQMQGGPQAAQRLAQQAAQAIPQMVKAQLAQQLAQSVTIRKTDDDPIHIDFYTVWCKSDEALLGDPLLMDAVDILIQEHDQADTQKAQEKTKKGMDAQAPMMAMQAAAAQAQQQQQQQAEQQKIAAQTQGKLALQHQKLLGSFAQAEQDHQQQQQQTLLQGAVDSAVPDPDAQQEVSE